jgi:hypothetical protein
MITQAIIKKYSEKIDLQNFIVLGALPFGVKPPKANIKKQQNQENLN